MEDYRQLPTSRRPPRECNGLSVSKFSYFRAPIQNKIPFRDIALVDLYKAIKGNYFKSITEKVRQADKTEYRSARGNTSEYKTLKQTLLPYATFAGTFKTRKNEDIKSLSGLMCFDFDHVDGPEDLKLKLSTEPGILMMFTSPSGDGLKVVYEDPIEEDNYKSQYEALREYFLSKHNLKGDTTQDISRACFVCHDPNVWLKQDEPTERYFETLIDGSQIEMSPEGYPLSSDVPMTSLTEKLIHRIGCEVHNDNNNTAIPWDQFARKPLCMPMLTVEQYRANGWKSF